MATTQTQCPNCHQSVPLNVKACPHCGVYLQLPMQPHPEALLGVAQASSRTMLSSAPLPQAATAQSLPDALKQLDSAASMQLTISGVLIAFYAGAIFAGKVLADPFHAFIFVLPVLSLLAAIILSIRVFHPAGYLTDDYPTLIRTKDARLRHSSLLLEISIGMLAVAVFVYLIRPF